MNTADIGHAVTLLGGGRMKKEDSIDFSVGVEMKVELGSEVRREDVLCYVYHNGLRVEEATDLLRKSVIIGNTRPQPHKIAYAFVNKEGVHIY